MTDKMIMKNSADGVRSTLKFQFDISWQLLEYHLNGLSMAGRSAS